MAISTIGQNGLTVPLTSNTITSASATNLTLQSAGTTAVTIDTSQNVGIGTTSTSAKLSVSLGGVSTLGQQSNQALALLGGGSNNQLCQIGMGYGTGTTYTPTAIGSITTTQTGNTIADLIFATRSVNTDTAPSERMRIDSSGVLVIGNTSGSAATRLVVYGSGSGSNTLAIFRNSNAATLVSLAENATSWAAGSDPRLKNITGTYTTPLADIAHIRPIKFTWKADSTNAPQVGVDATTVEPVVPEAIGRTKLIEGDETEYLTVKYQELIPLMIASIQELKAINDQQAETINALTARIEALENK